MAYNRSEITAHTRATSQAMNAEFTKIQQAFEEVSERLNALIVGDGQPSFMWVAYADSADGTANFTTDEPGARKYIGIAYNRALPEESTIPSDYAWSRFRGQDGQNGQDGTNGTNGSAGQNGTFVDFRFQRASVQPETPLPAEPAGWSNTIPIGTGVLWFITARKTATNILLSPWSVPERISSLPPPTQYDATKTYHEGDMVLFNGGTYIAIAPTVTGTAPSGTDQANSYWDVIASPGTAGTPATPPSSFSATIDLASTATGVNLRTIAEGAGYTGMSDADITFVVPNGVTIIGTGNGGNAIDTGTWPSAYTVALSLTVASGGKVYGGGGRGGAGGSGQGGMAGSKGGDGLFARNAIDVEVAAGGQIAGAGGGGGGANGWLSPNLYEPMSHGGGGGGGGFPNGAGGAAGFGDSADGNAGQAGTLLGGGTGGTSNGNGGTGWIGGAMAAVGGGVRGGAAGFAIRKNSHTVDVVNNGSIVGAVA